MQNPVAKIHCPNPSCEFAHNEETQKFCTKCRTPLPRRYLWALGTGLGSYKQPELVAERYFRKSEQIFLDTKPGLPPTVPEDIPTEIGVYLKLFPYRLHLPQVYGQLPLNTKNQVWLLEGSPIDPENLLSAGVKQISSSLAQLYPPLLSVWKAAPPMRQLIWLWQMAQLWEPCRKEGVASSLLNPKLLRVEGPLLRLLELQIDSHPPQLSQLGMLWLQWSHEAHPLIAPFLEELSRHLTDNKLNISTLLEILDHAIKLCAQTQKYTYSIATGTDTGPTRRRNEDACYPVAGTYEKAVENPLVIVCDGIGGHEGGNVASNSAIQAIQKRIDLLIRQFPTLDPQTVQRELEDATCIANDAISERNNSEQRQGRQRMGTTVVMALANGHEIYVSHVGDSRAYWISDTGCYQVTLDDDMATREVRLGYAVYRDAIEQPASGSLIQALGMANSGLLHPSASRFVIDGNALFLLCSDGLSDNDRVEQFWESELSGVLTGQKELSQCAQDLIEIANRENGHDNVTVGLLLCRVQPNPQANVSAQMLVSQLADWPELSQEDTPSGLQQPATAPTTIVPAHTQVLPQAASPTSKNLLPWLLAGLTVVAVPVLAYFFVPKLQAKVNSVVSVKPTNTIPPVVISPPSTPPVTPPLDVGTLVRTNAQVANQTLQLFANPGSPQPLATIPPGSLLKILDRQKNQYTDWLSVQVCWLPETSPSPPTATQSPKKLNSIVTNPQPKSSIKAEVSATITPPSTTAIPGQTGWVKEERLSSLLVKKSLNSSELPPEHISQCTATPSKQ